MGGLRAVEQLQMVFGYRNAHVFPERVFIPTVAQKFPADGRPIDPQWTSDWPGRRAQFAQFCGTFQTLVKPVRGKIDR